MKGLSIKWLGMSAGLLLAGCISQKLPMEFTYKEFVSNHPEFKEIVIPAEVYWQTQQDMRVEAAARGERFEEDMFRIQIGSRVNIEVVGEKDFTREVTVNPEGVFDYYYDIVDVPAAGMTPSELRTYLRGRLKKYIRDPQVLINLNEATSTVSGAKPYVGSIAIMGEVKSAGVTAYSGSDTVFDAIHKAGGLTNDSEWKEVAIIRREKGKGVIIVCNAEKFYKRADLRQDIKVRPNDIIFVPRNLTVYEHFERDFDTLTKLMGSISSTYSFEQLVENDILGDGKK